MQVSHVWLREARHKRGWTQAAAAARLGVSQAYLSLLESGHRRVPEKLVPLLRRSLAMPATALPVRENDVTNERLASALAALGYEPLAYLQTRLALNPAEVLLAALRRPELESRLTEALPWLVLRHALDLNWDWLVERTKVHDAQNRLGYVVALACQLAEKHGEADKADRLRDLEARLERSRLVVEGTLCHDSMSAAERKWLKAHRTRLSRHWNLLTDLTVHHLAQVSETPSART